MKYFSKIIITLGLGALLVFFTINLTIFKLKETNIIEPIDSKTKVNEIKSTSSPLPINNPLLKQEKIALTNTSGLQITNNNQLSLLLDGETLVATKKGLKIRESSVTHYQLSLGVAGNGLEGGGGLPLNVNVDAKTIRITGDMLQTTTQVSLLGQAIDSSEIIDGSINNNDISTTAAIDESKLKLNFLTHSNANDPTITEKTKLTELVNTLDNDISLGNKNTLQIHDQNTDTGTLSNDFQIDLLNTGPRINNNLGTLEVKDSTGTSYANLQAANLQGSSLNITGDIDFNGLLIAGTGNVQLTNSAGQLQALNTTYLSNLSGANLTNLNATALTTGTVSTTLLNGNYANITGVGTLNSLTVNGNTKLSNITTGSLLFTGTGGLITQDNINLFWNNTTKFLGVGTNSPQRTLHIAGVMRLDTTSTPTTPIKGDLYSDGLNIYFYNGISWDDLTKTTTLPVASYGEINSGFGIGTVNAINSGQFYVLRMLNVGIVKGVDYVVADIPNSSLIIGIKGGGLYKVSANSFIGLPITSLAWCFVFKNGIAQNNIGWFRLSGNPTPNTFAASSGLLYLNPGDVIDLRCSSSTAGDTITAAQSNLNIYRIE